MEKITLGITTFKRVDALGKLLNQVSSSGFLRQTFDVVIVNDSGTAEMKDKYQSLCDTYKDSLKLVMHHNEQNLGLPRTFAKLVDQIDTPYFLFMPDDDLIIPDKVNEILAFIEENQPSLLAARWLNKSKKVGRGVFDTRRVRMEEFRLASGHFSGIFFNTKQMQEVTTRVLVEIEVGNAAAMTYPAVFYHIPIILKYDNSWWYDADIVREGDGLASTVKDASGEGYASKSSRFQQISGFDTYINSFDKSDSLQLILRESRAWSIKKAVQGDLKLKERLIELLAPGIITRIRRKAKKIYKLT